MSYELRLPEDFDDYAWEVESKGVFWTAKVFDGSRLIPVTFYDRERLAQDLSEEVGPGRAVVLNRVVVIERITLARMYAAVSVLEPGSLE